MVMVLLFGACKNDNLEDIHPDIYVTPKEPCDSLNLNFTLHIQPLLISKCGATDINCHASGNTQDINLDNYTDVKDLAVNDDLMGSILHEPGYTPMPDNGGRLDACSTGKIRNWVNSGEPE
jgi:hypothetical protein